MDDFSGSPLDVLEETEKRRVCEQILDKKLESDEEAKADIRALIVTAFGCIIISLLALIPIFIPVLVISDFQLALRTASVIVSIILFFVGYLIAPYLGTNKWLTGLLLTGSTLIIAVISVFSGG